MKECLNCKKEFEPKKPHGKFCCANCRVAFNRKKTPTDMPVSPCMQELYNSIMAGINAISAKNGQPPAIAAIFVPEMPKEAILGYNELVDAITSATSSTQLHSAWKRVEKNKELGGWQIKQLNQFKEDQRTKIDF